MACGAFITFEGLDGSGKTTQLQLLAEWLETQGHTTVRMRNPGGTPLGDRIRGILLDSQTEAALGPIAPLAELALMFADRAQSIAQIVKPALGRGQIVLCDRYTDSSEAYQGGGRELGPARVLALHHALCEDLQPDLTVLLLPDLETSLSRARGRNRRNVQEHGTDENRFEREDHAFFRRIYQAYEVLAAREPERIAVIRSNGTVEDVAAEVRGVVAARVAVGAQA